MPILAAPSISIQYSYNSDGNKVWSEPNCKGVLIEVLNVTKRLTKLCFQPYIVEVTLTFCHLNLYLNKRIETGLNMHSVKGANSVGTRVTHDVISTHTGVIWKDVPILWLLIWCKTTHHVIKHKTIHSVDLYLLLFQCSCSDVFHYHSVTVTFYTPPYLTLNVPSRACSCACFCARACRRVHACTHTGLWEYECLHCVCLCSMCWSVFTSCPTWNVSIRPPTSEAQRCEEMRRDERRTWERVSLVWVFLAGGLLVCKKPWYLTSDLCDGAFPIDGWSCVRNDGAFWRQTLDPNSSMQISAGSHQLNHSDSNCAPTESDDATLSFCEAISCNDKLTCKSRHWSSNKVE